MKLLSTMFGHLTAWKPSYYPREGLWVQLLFLWKWDFELLSSSFKFYTTWYADWKPSYNTKNTWNLCHTDLLEWSSAFAVQFFLAIKYKCSYSICYAKEAIEIIQSFIQIAFTDLCRSGIAKSGYMEKLCQEFILILLWFLL